MDQPVKIILHRLIEDKYGTHGELKTEEGVTLCCTIERPWLNNQQGVSCIPLGEYQCVPHDSPAHPESWQVTGVPDRTEILIHTGNTIADTEGCIIVGTVATANGVAFSTVAMNKLRETLPPHFVLEVYSDEGEAPLAV